MFLEVSQLQVRYGQTGRPAVDGVAFGLQAGDIGVLIGPSGCGKTTLLRAVAGLEPVSAGEIRLDNQVVSAAGVNLPPEQRRIGMVFQDYALFPHLDVGDNVAFGIHHLGRAERTRRVFESMELLALEHAPEMDMSMARMLLATQQEFLANPERLERWTFAIGERVTSLTSLVNARADLVLAWFDAQEARGVAPEVQP